MRCLKCHPRLFGRRATTAVSCYVNTHGILSYATLLEYATSFILTEVNQNTTAGAAGNVLHRIRLDSHLDLGHTREQRYLRRTIMCHTISTQKQWNARAKQMKGWNARRRCVLQLGQPVCSSGFASSFLCGTPEQSVETRWERVEGTSSYPLWCGIRRCSSACHYVALYPKEPNLYFVFCGNGGTNICLLKHFVPRTNPNARHVFTFSAFQTCV